MVYLIFPWCSWHITSVIHWPYVRWRESFHLDNINLLDNRKQKAIILILHRLTGNPPWPKRSVKLMKKGFTYSRKGNGKYCSYHNIWCYLISVQAHSSAICTSPCAVYVLRVSVGWIHKPNINPCCCFYSIYKKKCVLYDMTLKCYSVGCVIIWTKVNVTLEQKQQRCD